MTLAELSPRRRQVLEGIARGLCQKEIAFELGISVKTVEATKDTLHKQTNTHTSVELLLHFYELRERT